LRSLARAVATLLICVIAAPVALAADRTGVTVTIDPTESGAVARFKLDRAVRSFRLGYPWDEGTRDRTWKVATPDITREGALVTAKGGAEFDAFAVEVQAWNEVTDATYPCLFRVGAHGLAFYAAYFTGIDTEFETTIEVAPAQDRIVEGFPRGGRSWRVDTTFQGDAAHRYVYIGKRGDVVETTSARLVLPPGPGQEMIDRIRDNVERMMRFYHRKFAHGAHQTADPSCRKSHRAGDSASRRRDVRTSRSATRLRRPLEGPRKKIRAHRSLHRS